jgi:coenzyme F420-0:L-glutamate ligase / coenzyme F420-1:gamma-L-glutamate ligase
VNPKISHEEWLVTRRSVRSFTGKSIDKSIIKKIIEIGVHAPNAHNRQPWRFVVLSSEEKRKQLAESMEGSFRNALIQEGQSVKAAAEKIKKSKSRLVSAGVAILVCYDSDEMDQHTDMVRNQGELIIGMQSVAMAGNQILLAAHSMGLGGVWVCSPLFAQNEVISSFDLASSWYPQGLILLGHPALPGKYIKRKPVDEVTTYLE